MVYSASFQRALATFAFIEAFIDDSLTSFPFRFMPVKEGILYLCGFWCYDHVGDLGNHYYYYEGGEHDSEYEAEAQPGAESEYEYDDYYLWVGDWQ